MDRDHRDAYPSFLIEHIVGSNFIWPVDFGPRHGKQDSVSTSSDVSDALYWIERVRWQGEVVLQHSGSAMTNTRPYIGNSEVDHGMDRRNPMSASISRVRNRGRLSTKRERSELAPREDVDAPRLRGLALALHCLRSEASQTGQRQDGKDQKDLLATSGGDLGLQYVMRGGSIRIPNGWVQCSGSSRRVVSRDQDGGPAGFKCQFMIDTIG